MKINLEKTMEIKNACLPGKKYRAEYISWERINIFYERFIKFSSLIYEDFTKILRVNDV